MATCCEDKGCEVAALRASHSRVLWIVLPINSLMFLVKGELGDAPPCTCRAWRPEWS